MTSALAILLCASITSHAASGQVVFSGQVVKPSSNGTTNYPHRLVSFSDHILLPLSDLHNSLEGQIAVFSRNGRIEHQLVNPVVDNATGGMYAVVLLDGNVHHSFQICIGVETTSDCLRYEVVRAD